jgi:hypothetical protein
MKWADIQLSDHSGKKIRNGICALTAGVISMCSYRMKRLGLMKIVIEKLPDAEGPVRTEIGEELFKYFSGLGVDPRKLIIMFLRDDALVLV